MNISFFLLYLRFMQFVVFETTRSNLAGISCDFHVIDIEIFSSLQNLRGIHNSFLLKKHK